MGFSVGAAQCLVAPPYSNVRYFGVFLTTAGANSNIPATMSYQANNIRGQWKRAFCSAILVGMGGVGGIAGGLVFREQDKPGYEPGLYACIACCLLTIVIVILITLRSWSLYNVCAFHSQPLRPDTNMCTGWRPEGLQIHLLKSHQA